MDNALLKKYQEYASTTESFAVLLVKKHLTESKGHWVDVGNCERYEMSDNNLHFRFVTGGLYKRIIKPKYPSKSDFTVNGVFDERSYYFMARAITWEAAHKDIEQQKSKNVKGKSFKIVGVSYDKNRSNNNFFNSDAPAEIKALAKNLSDRTNPLWDKAMDYVNEPEFVYKIKKAGLV